MRANWTVYIVTDTGREIPHWTAPTRMEARAVVIGIKAVRPHVRTHIRKEGK